jgi:hypothetical protein
MDPWIKQVLAEAGAQVRDLIVPYLDPPDELLDSLSQAVAEKRDEAKKARTSNGIEGIWEYCEEAYVGIDNANRGEFGGSHWSKPMVMNAPVTTDRAQRGANTKSTAYVRLTARYVDAATAKIAEILLPADDKAFSISATPVPDLIKALGDKSPVVLDNGQPAMRNLKPGEQPPPVAPSASQPPAPQPLPPGPVAPAPAAPLSTPAPPVAGAAPAPAAASPLAGLAALSGQPQGAAPGAPAPPAQPQVQITAADLAQEHLDLLEEQAKKAEDRIYDWMIESRYRAEIRKLLFDGSRLGVGVLKGPFPKFNKAMAVSKILDPKRGPGIEVKFDSKVQPGFSWLNPWNAFPDPACGENIHDGDYFLERDYLSRRQVRELKKLPGYIEDQIDLVLEEDPDDGSQNEKQENQQPGPTRRKGRYEVWYFYGSIKREELACCYRRSGRRLLGSDVSADQKEVYAIVTMINRRVIRAAINPLDSGSFPYHSFPWQRRSGSWAGIGVAEQMKMPQTTTNAGVRAMLNNAGISAGSQVVIDLSAIVPADGVMAVTPNKIWYRSKDVQGPVSDAFQVFNIPNMTDQLMKIVQFGMQLAEESTSIPLITQGQSGPTTPETLGATQLQDTNANQLLRSVGYSFDDHITEPVVLQSYEWLLLDPNVPDDEKGDFQIDAHGSVALVERAIADQTIAGLVTSASNPIYGLNPRRTMKQYIKSKRLKADDFANTEQEQSKIDASPPQPYQVQVAQANNQSREKIAAGDQAIEKEKADNDQREVATEATVELHRISVLESQVKALLAGKAMQLNVEQQLNAQNNAADIHKHHNPVPAPAPPAQVPGRAADGHAFDQAAE